MWIFQDMPQNHFGFFSSPSLLYMVSRHVLKQRLKPRLNHLGFWLIFFLLSSGGIFLIAHFVLTLF